VYEKSAIEEAWNISRGHARTQLERLKKTQEIVHEDGEICTEYLPNTRQLE
jgi:chemotaxis protein CheY-P-specific phosphatase CheC